MAKYYTPTIEELLSFIVNEKYCYAPSKSGKMIFKVDFNDGFANALKSFIEGSDYDSEKGFSINPKVNRLKYLDREDIENVGWTSTGGHLISGSRDEFEMIYDDPRKVNDKVGLIYTYSKRHALITIGNYETPFPDWQTIFAGKIKDISDFKIILKQIGVLDAK